MTSVTRGLFQDSDVDVTKMKDLIEMKILNPTFALKTPKLIGEPAQLRTSVANKVGSGLSCASSTPVSYFNETVFSVTNLQASVR